ncbi:hypothetical protein VOLCADRAFT_94597 [Volvox carteri f. nagariensis]|uniref:MATH domain-containing protein n=1 Tax=Volvox carteri f. nagariensis TaxID=3068 RepID=D8U577_VOLCA|nr:uncharacterized protein VOLCADRAFT_94597 [Volvox carteri f. nagariensis]EFJ45165.1 hypothetical protein VOLCADRAFT_94597 [Volvox carteri f. nagariensis]|eukprot:XP_002953841.1 hypothetical protein VOLCADRAFT_94597 [Volvox carteri f. nagariensis]
MQLPRRFTLARAMGPGTRLCSDLFEVGGQLFRLELYPAGLNSETHKYVSLFLTTPGVTQPMHLLYELSILDKGQSRPQHITESRTVHAPFPAEPAAILAPQPGVVAGFPKCIKTNFLHRNARRFLPDDTLTIRATVKVLAGKSSFPVVPSAAQLYSLQPNRGLVSPFPAWQAPPPSTLHSPAGGVLSPPSSYMQQPAYGCGCYASAHPLQVQLPCMQQQQQFGGQSGYLAAYAPCPDAVLNFSVHVFQAAAAKAYDRLSGPNGSKSKIDRNESSLQ